jgi:hypothetical protein
VFFYQIRSFISKNKKIISFYGIIFWTKIGTIFGFKRSFWPQKPHFIKDFCPLTPKNRSFWGVNAPFMGQKHSKKGCFLGSKKGDPFLEAFLRPF